MLCSLNNENRYLNTPTKHLTATLLRNKQNKSQTDDISSSKHIFSKKKVHPNIQLRESVYV